MSWIGVGVAAAGAVSGAQTAKANRRKARDQDQYRKAALTYSPWTGMGDPGAANVGNTDTFSGMLGGAAQGYALGSGVGGALQKAGALGGSASKLAGSAGSPLGGDAMASNLGAEFTGQGSGLQQAQNALGGAGNAQGMWSQMGKQTGMKPSIALGGATDQMFQKPQGSWLGMGQQQPSYLGMNGY